MAILGTFFDQVTTATSEEVFFADFKEEWGNPKPRHRMEIRKAILEYLKRNHPDEANDSILDLEAPPVLKTLFVSISHCNSLGGFVICSKPVGFDLENTSRLNPKLIERVSTPEERSVAPTAEILWSAKEAVFKCDNRFMTISQVHITRWDMTQDETYRFRIFEIEGWARKGPDFTCALAIKKS